MSIITQLETNPVLMISQDKRQHRYSTAKRGLPRAAAGLSLCALAAFVLFGQAPVQPGIHTKPVRPGQASNLRPRSRPALAVRGYIAAAGRSGRPVGVELTRAMVT